MYVCMYTYIDIHYLEIKTSEKVTRFKVTYFKLVLKLKCDDRKSGANILRTHVRKKL